MDAIAALTTPVADPTAVSNSNPNDGMGKDAFLQLMVAQLRYQDPMNPADSQSFLAQTAQFTSVEKLEEIAASMASMSRNDELSTIGTMVGKNVRFLDEVGNNAEALVTAGRTTEDGIILTTTKGDVHLDSVSAIVATPD